MKRHQNQASEARRELERERERLPTPKNLEPPIDRWLPLYHRRICDYLLDNLTEDSMPSWRTAYTALHEMVSHAWANRPGSSNQLEEKEAWDAVDALAHLAFTQVHTLLHHGFSHYLFWDHYDAFILYLRDQDAMSVATARRLRAEYRALLDPKPRAVA